MKKIIPSVLASTLISSSVFSANLIAEQPLTISNKQKVIALLNSIETADQQAISYLNPEQYTQHNLALEDGLAGFGALLQQLPKDSARVKVIRAFEEGDYVFTHTDYNFFGPKIGFDVFKFENGLIVEHWDNLTDKAQQKNPSGRSQIDGPTTITDHNKTSQNKALVKSFITTILINGQFDKMDQYFDGDNYIQHNSAVPDTVSGLVNALGEMAKQGITMVYQHNHAILGEGNFVLSISEGLFAGKKTSFYDLFRIEDGKIAEHWDVIETLLNKQQWKNNNGKFTNL